VLWTSSAREARVSLKDDTTTPHIDLAELAEQARASSRRELVRAHFPKRTIHSFVGEIATRPLEANKMVAKAEKVIGDSTKVRTQAGREMNNGFKNAYIHNEAFI